jgi:hypothetical protein
MTNKKLLTDNHPVIVAAFQYCIVIRKQEKIYQSILGNFETAVRTSKVLSNIS